MQYELKKLIFHVEVLLDNIFQIFFLLPVGFEYLFLNMEPGCNILFLNMKLPFSATGHWVFS